MGVVPVLVRARPQKAILQVGGRVARGRVINVVVFRVGGHDVLRSLWREVEAISSIALSRYSSANDCIFC